MALKACPPNTPPPSLVGDGTIVHTEFRGGGTVLLRLRSVRIALLNRGWLLTLERGAAWGSRTGPGWLRSSKLGVSRAPMTVCWEEDKKMTKSSTCQISWVNPSGVHLEHKIGANIKASWPSNVQAPGVLIVLQGFLPDHNGTAGGSNN